MSNLMLGAREFTRNMGKYLDKISDDKVNVVVTRSKGEDVVVMPMSEYDSIIETLYLLRSPANAEHLRRGMAEVEAAMQGANIGTRVTNPDELWN